MARILVIDRDPNGYARIQGLLGAAGHETVHATHCREGLELHEAEPADLILMDVVVPMQLGLETIEGFHKAHPSVKILLVSGSGEEWWPTNLTADHAGLTQQIHKPYSDEELGRAVRDLLDADTAGS